MANITQSLCRTERGRKVLHVRKRVEPHHADVVQRVGRVDPGGPQAAAQLQVLRRRLLWLALEASWTAMSPHAT